MMALRVSEGKEDRSISMDVAVSVATGRVEAVTVVASASGVGRRGLEKTRDVARNADVAAVMNGRAMPLLVNSSPLSLLLRRAAAAVVAVGDESESCGCLTATADLVIGVVNASALPREDAANETAAMAASRQRQDDDRWFIIGRRGGVSNLDRCRRRRRRRGSGNHHGHGRHWSLSRCCVWRR